MVGRYEVVDAVRNRPPGFVQEVLAQVVVVLTKVDHLVVHRPRWKVRESRGDNSLYVAFAVALVDGERGVDIGCFDEAVRRVHHATVVRVWGRGGRATPHMTWWLNGCPGVFLFAEVLGRHIFANGGSSDEWLRPHRD